MEKNYKRQDRSVSQETREKISKSLQSYNARNPRTDAHKQHIARGVKDYWRQIPKKEVNATTMEDIML